MRMSSQLVSKLLDKKQLQKGHLNCTFLPEIAVTYLSFTELLFSAGPTLGT